MYRDPDLQSRIASTMLTRKISIHAIDHLFLSQPAEEIENAYTSRLSVKRKLHPERSHVGITRSALVKCLFFNRVVIIGTSTGFP